MDTTTVRVLMQGTIIVYGIYTHNKYQFTPEIQFLQIDNKDLPDILAKKEIQGGCCGNPRIEKPIFELVE